MDRPAIYEIRVQGQLNDHRLSWFEGMSLTCDVTSVGLPVTLLTGPVLDTRALSTASWPRYRDLGLPLISVERVQAGFQRGRTLGIILAATPCGRHTVQMRPHRAAATC